jgi:hypothetical protein
MTDPIQDSLAVTAGIMLSRQPGNALLNSAAKRA